MILTELDFEKTLIEAICPICKIVHSVVVKTKDIEKWDEGELIQNCFPYLSDTQREQLISNFCPKCQKEIFD